MRLFMILCWLTVPLLAWAYHVGPGQERLATDRAGSLVRQATAAANAEDFDQATSRYAEALGSLPEDRRSDSYRVRLALAQSQMHASQLPEARVALETGAIDRRR